MKFLLKIVLVVSAFKAVIVLFLLVGAIIAWINGVSNILIPGLGLIISMRLIVIFLLAAELFSAAIAAFVWRHISKMRLQ